LYSKDLLIFFKNYLVLNQNSVREIAQAAVANNSVSTQQLNMAAAAAQWLNLNQTNDCQPSVVTMESLNAQQANLQQQIAQAEQNFNSQLMVRNKIKFIK